jgi:hypothetical protein
VAGVAIFDGALPLNAVLWGELDVAALSHVVQLLERHAGVIAALDHGPDGLTPRGGVLGLVGRELAGRGWAVGGSRSRRRAMGLGGDLLDCPLLVLMGHGAEVGVQLDRSYAVNLDSGRLRHGYSFS